MSTKYVFQSFATECVDEDGRESGNQKIEIVLTKADEMTYQELCIHFKAFLIASGFDYLRGPLEFPEMEAEKTLDRLRKPERDITG